MAIVAHHNLSDLTHERRPLAHHKAGLQFTRSGYGNRIPTEHVVKLPGEKIWRRVYVCIWSNSGTAYVDVKGDWVVIVGGE